MAELLDLAHTMRTEAMEAAAIEIDIVSHEATARRLARELDVTVDELGLNGSLEQEEHLVVGTHFGTHLDAPTHYADEIEGRPADTVDRMPLRPLLAPSVVLDFSSLGPEAITAAMLEQALAGAGVAPRPGLLVVTRTGIGERYRDDPSIRRAGAGLDASGIAWLLEHGVTYTATDSMTQDLPIPWMEEQFKAGNRDAYFPVHLAGKRTPYVHVEKAAGLAGVPAATEVWTAAFPIRVEGGSGAWTRFHALGDVPFDAGAVEVVDLAQPIRRESMERVRSVVRTHGPARRQRQWAKHLGVPVGDVEARGSWDQVEAPTRAGTHLAAPARWSPGARTVEDVPLSWCVGPGVVLDVAEGPRDAAVTLDEVRRALATAGRELRGGDIVLFHTGAEAAWDGNPGYPDAGRGVTVEALEWLLGEGVRVVGTDAESFDRPRAAIIADGGPLFPVLRAARGWDAAQLLQVGGLAALAQRRPTGFWVDAAPTKVEDAGSGWCRPVALIAAS